MTRPRLCELPDRLVRNGVKRTFARVHNRTHGTTTWTMIYDMPRGDPAYRWTRMEPGATRRQAAAAVLRMRTYLQAIQRQRSLH